MLEKAREVENRKTLLIFQMQYKKKVSQNIEVECKIKNYFCSIL